MDRTFIDTMVRHHQGAIRMARVAIRGGEHPGVEALARAIVQDNANEIEAMNAWRKRWYGRPSPAGGVEDATSTHSPKPSDDL